MVVTEDCRGLTRSVEVGRRVEGADADLKCPSAGLDAGQAVRL